MKGDGLVEGEDLLSACVGGFPVGAVGEFVDGDGWRVGVDDLVVRNAGIGVDVAFAPAVEMGGAGREDLDDQQRGYG